MSSCADGTTFQYVFRGKPCLGVFLFFRYEPCAEQPTTLAQNDGGNALALLGSSLLDDDHAHEAGNDEDTVLLQLGVTDALAPHSNHPKTAHPYRYSKIGCRSSPGSRRWWLEASNSLSPVPTPLHVPMDL